jgi:XTP/dITP diphosphohydrolase
MKLVFATHNHNKLREIQLLVPKHIKVVSLHEIGCTDPIPETADTLEGNAKLKANFVFKNYNLPCFADDTGLMVNALNGAPGVYSARYAGEANDANANMNKLLHHLNGIKDRSASFKTVIALRLSEKVQFFEGLVQGEICIEKKGSDGFGYDPIFQPLGYTKTFAQLPISVKNEIGHRGKAFTKLIEFLRTLNLTI